MRRAATTPEPRRRLSRDGGPGRGPTLGHGDTALSAIPQPQANRPETRLQRAVGLLSTTAGVAAALMILASVLITCQMIWLRFVMNVSTIWQTEAVIYLMIGATLLGLGYVQRVRGHVNVDLIPGLLPAGARRVLSAVTLLLAIAVMGSMLWYGFDLWRSAFERGWRSGTAWGVKLWVPYLAMPVGFGLYVLQLAADLAAELTPAAEPAAEPAADPAADRAAARGERC